jgi:hypothetical protein
VRVDAAREQRFEPGVDARPAEPFLDQRVEAEPGEMPFVEDDRMAERDRLAVIRLFSQQIEQRARPRAVLQVPGDER